MRHVWIGDVDFAWALYVFLRNYERDFPEEPIPWPSQDDVNRAAGTIAAINQPFFGKRLYRTLPEKLAALAYELCKQHFFLNGNKRIAYFFFIYAMVLNGVMIDINTFEERAALMESVAQSDPKDRANVLRDLADFIRKNLRPYTVPSRKGP